MKTAIVTAITLLLSAAAPASAAEADPVTVLFSGGPQDNRILIDLSEDGRSYVVDSVAQLEVGSEICVHPEDDPNRLICEATAIASFEVNAGGGDDAVLISRAVPIPVTLRGGPGADHLYGGAGDDKLVGGAGDDVLVGRMGDDRIYGGPGDDKLVGASGDDLLRAGSGRDQLFPGKGEDRVVRKRAG